MRDRGGYAYGPICRPRPRSRVARARSRPALRQQPVTAKSGAEYGGRDRENRSPTHGLSVLASDRGIHCHSGSLPRLRQTRPRGPSRSALRLLWLKMRVEDDGRRHEEHTNSFQPFSVSPSRTPISRPTIPRTAVTACWSRVASEIGAQPPPGEAGGRATRQVAASSAALAPSCHDGQRRSRCRAAGERGRTRGRGRERAATLHCCARAAHPVLAIHMARGKPWILACSARLLGSTRRSLRGLA